ncbi:hypothetical protein SAY86_008242 [Trapa natans]|uniref:Uncharacterized protein n=1 Tax=Trapa natans TaxID=22666 RepID=A0AAN7K960_TRANT|nr:hypothetical protein SAY86_008242 [Trapa natans]
MQEATNGKKPTMPFSKSVDRGKASKLLSPRAKVSTTNEEKLRKDTAPCREKLLFEKKKLVSKSHHTDEEKLRKDTSLSREKLLVEKKKPVSNSHHINEEKLRKGTAPCREKLPVEKKKPVSNSYHTNEEKLNKDTALSREKLFVEKKKKPFFKSLHTNEEKLRKDTARSREKLLVEKKKPFPKSLHMSISFAPSNVSTSKTISPVLQQIIKLRDITASTKLQQEIPVAQKLPDGASVHAKNTVTPVILKSEDRRMKGLLNKSDAGRPMMGKSSSLLHKENSKYSFANGVKSQPPVVCTPFRFRSEERAAKRKEKQEEKLKALEAEKMKASEGNRLLTMPSRSPELAKKASQGIGSQTKPKPLQQTSYRVDNANQRIGKSNNPNAKAPILSLLSSRSHAHENSSPNIPQ